MTQCELPMPLCKDDEDDVTFFDAQYDNNHDDTLPDQEVERKLSIPQNGGDHEVNFVSVQNENVYNESLPDEELKLEHEPQDLDEVQPRPPVQLLEDDPEISSVEQVTIQTLEELNVKREMAAKAQLINHSVMVREVNRHNCVNELLSLYKDQNIVNCELLLSFQGEDAAGDGVRREVYCLLGQFCFQLLRGMLSLYLLCLCSLITRRLCCHRSPFKSPVYPNRNTAIADIRSDNAASRCRKSIRRLLDKLLLDATA